MKTEIFTLCDSAVEYNGKAVIVGTINDVNGTSYPLTIPSVSLFARVAFEPEESADSTLSVLGYNVDDPELVITRFVFPLKVSPSPNNRMNYINIILKLDGLHIPKQGVYCFELKTPDWSDKIVLYANLVNPQ